LWIPLAERLLLKWSLDYVDRKLAWRDDRGRLTKIENTAVVPGVGLQVRPRGGKTYLEAGLAAEYRRRTEEHYRSGLGEGRRDDRYQDHRIYLVYEYRFADAKIIRLIETIDLDREDWGSFSIHDHAFVQLLFEF
jgi:hypothetical protein